MRKAGAAHLPKFPNETEPDYKFRLSNAKFTNIFGDIVETLASKPFTTEIVISGAGARAESFVENIDGHGSHLHQFAAQSFYAGVAYANARCPIGPGDFCVEVNRTASGLATVTAGTGDIIRVANSAGAQAKYLLAILARSA